MQTSQSQLISLLLNKQQLSAMYRDYRMLLRNNRSLKILYLIIQFEYRIQQGVNQSLLTLAKQSKPINPCVAYYFSAKCLYLKGKYRRSIIFINTILARFPAHMELIYLKSKCLHALGDIAAAQQLLYAALVTNPKRKKTWLYLASLVCTKADFHQFEQYFQQYCLPINEPSALVYLDYYSEAALRAEAYKEAKAMWQHGLVLLQQHGWQQPNSKKAFNPKAAERALLDLHTVLTHTQIPFFLVSGTLLGCIRNGEILPHDNDLDVGVWEEVNHKALYRAVSHSGYFDILPACVPERIRLKHVNGVYIDVFYHIKQQNRVWHAGSSKLKWFNSPFELRPHRFLGKDFLIPANPERYLIENYGKDWQIPQTQFDSKLDTPNLEIFNQKEMLIFSYKTLFKLILCGKQDEYCRKQIMRYRQLIEELEKITH